MKHIVSLSGGIGSFITLKKVLETNNKKDVIAVFCDVLKEDGDLYRFLQDIEEKFDIRITRLCTGKTPLQCQIKDKFIYNSRVANCSKELKIKPFKNYLKTIDDDYIIYLGIDWTEAHRCDAAIKNYAPHEVRFPMCEPPYLTKQEMLLQLNEFKIKMPRLYELGFTHNNCKGECVKAGIGHWTRLLEQDRNRFLEAENEELMLQQIIGKPHTHF